MAKNNQQNNKKRSKKSSNVQEQLNDVVNSSELDIQNEGHNVKKQSLGPNTKR